MLKMLSGKKIKIKIKKLTHHIACLMGEKKHAQHIDPENDKLLYRRERRCPDRPIPTRRNSGKE